MMTFIALIAILISVWAIAEEYGFILECAHCEPFEETDFAVNSNPLLGYLCYLAVKTTLILGSLAAVLYVLMAIWIGIFMSIS